MCSISQGSVLGPSLFVLYTANLAAEVKKHDVDLHTYGDDTQYICIVVAVTCHPL